VSSPGRSPPICVSRRLLDRKKTWFPQRVAAEQDVGWTAADCASSRPLFELHSWTLAHPDPYSVWVSSAQAAVVCHLCLDASGSDMLRIAVKPSAPALPLFAMLPARLPVSVVVEAVGSQRHSWVARVRGSWAWHRRRGTERSRASAGRWYSTWRSLWIADLLRSIDWLLGWRVARRTCWEMLGLQLLKMTAGEDRAHQTTGCPLVTAIVGSLTVTVAILPIRRNCQRYPVVDCHCPRSAHLFLCAAVAVVASS
jgi:hypothetical protein